MHPAELRDRCRSFTGAEETFPFGPKTSVFKVGGRMFALSQLDARIPPFLGSWTYRIPVSDPLQLRLFRAAKGLDRVSEQILPCLDKGALLGLEFLNDRQIGRAHV